MSTYHVQYIVSSRREQGQFSRPTTTLKFKSQRLQEAQSKREKKIDDTLMNVVVDIASYKLLESEVNCNKSIRSGCKTTLVVHL